MSDDLGYVSLFTGSGALDLGLERAGFKPLLFCENDKPCHTVLRHHWPDVPLIEDVKDVTAASVAKLGFDDLLPGGGDANGTHRRRLPLLAGGFP